MIRTGRAGRSTDSIELSYCYPKPYVLMLLSNQQITFASSTLGGHLVQSGVSLSRSYSVVILHSYFSEVLDRAQIRSHNAPHSVLVACTDDFDIFPSCQEVLSETLPWPAEDVATFGAQVSTLCPRIQSTLMEIPSSIKEQFYLVSSQTVEPHHTDRTVLGLDRGPWATWVTTRCFLDASGPRLSCKPLSPRYPSVLCRRSGTF